MSSLNNTFISKCGHLQVSVNAKSTPKTIHFPNKIVLILEEFLSDMTIPNMFPTPLVPHIESLPTFNSLGPGFTCLRLWPYLFFYHLCLALLLHLTLGFLRARSTLLIPLYPFVVSLCLVDTQQILVELKGSQSWI